MPVTYRRGGSDDASALAAFATRAFLRSHRDDGSQRDLEPPPARCAEAKHVYVDVAWHGTGIAAELMRQCCDAGRAAGCDWIWLAVWKHNARALAFYRKSGFRIGGEQTFQLGADRQDDWVMTKPLTESAS